MVDEEEWRWAFSSLCSVSTKGSLCMRVPDTVLLNLDSGEPERWLYTDGQTGNMKERRLENIGWAKIEKRFMRLAHANDPGRKSFVCVSYSNGRRRPVDRSGFAKLIKQGKSGKLRNVSVLQVYIRPKKSTGMFRCMYIYDENADEFHLSTVRLNKMNASKSHLVHINETLEEQTSLVVRFIEESQKVTIDELSVDFVIDKRDSIYLSGFHSIEVSGGIPGLDFEKREEKAEVNYSTMSKKTEQKDSDEVSHYNPLNSEKKTYNQMFEKTRKEDLAESLGYRVRPVSESGTIASRDYQGEWDSDGRLSSAPTGLSKEEQQNRRSQGNDSNRKHTKKRDKQSAKGPPSNSVKTSQSLKDSIKKNDKSKIKTNDKTKSSERAKRNFKNNVDGELDWQNLENFARDGEKQQRRDRQKQKGRQRRGDSLNARIEAVVGDRVGGIDAVKMTQAMADLTSRNSKLETELHRVRAMLLETEDMRAAMELAELEKRKALNAVQVAETTARDAKKKVASAQIKFMEVLREKDNETERRMLELESKLNGAMAQRGGDAGTDMKPVRDLISQVEELQLMMDTQAKTFEKSKQDMRKEHEETLVHMRKTQRFSDTRSLREKERLKEKIDELKQQVNSAKSDLLISERKSEDLRMRLDLESEKLGKSEEEKRGFQQTIQSLETEARALGAGEEGTAIQTLRAHNSSKVKHLTNEIDFLRAQMVSESQCKEELAASLAAVNEQFVVAKGAAKKLLQEQETARREEIREMEDTFRRKLEISKGESSRLEDKVKRLQLQMTEMMKDAAAARKKFQTMEEENLIVVQEKKLLTEKLESAQSMLKHAGDEQERHAKTAQMEGAIKSTMELRMRQIENESNFVRKQLAAERELREELEQTLKDAAQKVSDVEFKSNQEVDALRQDHSRELESRRQLDLKQDNTIIDLEGKIEKLESQLEEINNLHAREKAQRNTEKQVMDATQIALTKAQDCLETERKRREQAEDQIMSQQKSQKRAMNSVQTTLDSLEIQKSSELRALKKQLSDTLSRLSTTQQSMVSLRGQLSTSMTAHKKGLGAHQILHVLERWRKLNLAIGMTGFKRMVAIENVRTTMIRKKDDELFKARRASEQEKISELRIQGETLLKDKQNTLKVLEEEHKSNISRLKDAHRHKSNQMEEAATQYLHEQVAITARDVAARTQAVWEKTMADTVGKLSQEATNRQAKALEDESALHAGHLQKKQLEHNRALDELREAHEEARSEAINQTKKIANEETQKILDAQKNDHMKQMKQLRQEHLTAMTDQVTELEDKHQKALAKLSLEFDTKELLLKSMHDDLIAQLREDAEINQSRALENLAKEHNDNVQNLKTEKEEALSKLEKELREQAAREQSELMLQAERKHAAEIDRVGSASSSRAEQLEKQLSLAKQAAEIASTTSVNASAALGVSHAETLRKMESEHALNMHQAAATQTALREQKLAELSALHEKHVSELEGQHKENIEKIHIEHKNKMAKTMQHARNETEKLLKQITEDKENSLNNAQKKADEALELMATQSQQAMAVAVAAAQRKADLDKQSALEKVIEEANAKLEQNLNEANNVKEKELKKMEQHMSALMVQAATRSAEDQKAALAAQREDLEEEQQQAVAELKKESDQLISSFESALEQLRDESAETEAELEETQSKLEESQDHAFDLKTSLDKITKAGAYLQMRLSTMYVQWMASTTKIEKYHDSEVERVLHECKLDKEAACERLEHELKKQADRIASMESLKKDMQNALVNHKREMLMEHKVQSTVIQSDITQIAKQKVMLEAEHREHLTEMSSLEGGLKHMEVEIRDMSRRSAIINGEVDTDYMRKKRRLDSKFESCLKQIALKRSVLKECEDRLSELEDRHQVKEDELKELETGLVTLLVQQQKRMLQIISSAGSAGKTLQAVAKLKKGKGKK